ncbi:MAG: glycyl-radical enzyme activating protein [Oscillospiraceae bacterium]|nr:glycyl-radical enzyme activating protein [Oscillospiraceae bacterium]
MSETALIFNQVNGSFVDGWGIRTTIFLKGCPLRCKWCCNPEGQGFAPQLRYLEAHCSGCGNCLSACPAGAITLAEGKVVIDRSRCDNCGRCEQVCWQEALRITGQPQSAQEVFQSLLREKPFFDRSGGGLTIGGGEATCFPAFCLELIELCHGAGIPVAIDSCGYMAGRDSFRVLEAADLVLFDLKGMDPARHRANTGVDNAPILDTFRRLTELQKPVIVRLPVIPGHNDSPEELAAVTQLLSRSPNVARVDVLPYHTFGRVKYDELGMPYPMGDAAAPLSDGDVAGLVDQLTSAGLRVQIGG